MLRAKPIPIPETTKQQRRSEQTSKPPAVQCIAIISIVWQKWNRLIHCGFKRARRPTLTTYALDGTRAAKTRHVCKSFRATMKADAPLTLQKISCLAQLSHADHCFLSENAATTKVAKVA